MSTSKPRRPNRWPALKRRIEADIINDHHGAFDANVKQLVRWNCQHARDSIAVLTLWGCKVTLPRS